MSVLVFTWTLTRTKAWFPSSVLLPVCRHFQHELPEAVSSRSPHQAAPSGLHHPHPPLDFCAVLQSPALRLPAHRHALLHLRHHRHAGGGRRIACLFNHQSPGCDSNECFLRIRCLATLSWMTTLTSPNTTTSRPSPVRWCCCSGKTAWEVLFGWLKFHVDYFISTEKTKRWMVSIVKLCIYMIHMYLNFSGWWQSSKLGLLHID